MLSFTVRAATVSLQLLLSSACFVSDVLFKVGSDSNVITQHYKFYDLLF